MGRGKVWFNLLILIANQPPKLLLSTQKLPRRGQSKEDVITREEKGTCSFGLPLLPHDPWSVKLTLPLARQLSLFLVRLVPRGFHSPRCAQACRGVFRDLLPLCGGLPRLSEDRQDGSDYGEV